MKELFGLSMDTIMLALVAMLAVAIACVVFIFITNRMMFKMGLRNLRRRGLQTGLVVVGLMLATLITTAAFTTGDTVDFSIARSGYESLQRTDLVLNFTGTDTPVQNETAVYINEATVPELERQFASDPDIAAFLPLLFEPVSTVNQRTKQSEPHITLSGIDPQRIDAFGGLRLAEGGKADVAALGANDILLTQRAAEKLSARTGDTITVYANGTSAIVTVKGVVKDELITSGNARFFSKGDGGGVMLLSSVQRLTGHEGQISNVSVALEGDVATSYELSDSAVSRLEPFLQSDAGRQLLMVNNPVSVNTLKKDSVEEAETTGNLFTTFFLILGLFSIAAGVMLIFMIFVMLATERKAEMGMARAVGAQRSSLTQAFVSEGMAYSVLAGAVGAIVGVAAALGLVVGFLKLAGGFDFIEAHITARSLIVSYCLGVVLTFITVVVSSLKVSAVNIVAAIRGTEEDRQPAQRRKVRWLWVLAGIPGMVIPPLGVYFLFRKGFGVSWTWILAPLGIVLGLFTILSARDGGSGSEFLFSFGVSVLPLSVAAIASHYRAPGRLTWTLVGAYLALYWLAPIDYADLLFGTELSGDIEMFFLSGIMVVVSFSLVIVYNAQLLTAFFQRGAGPRYALTGALGAVAVACAVAGVLLGDRASGLGQLLYLLAIIVAGAAAFAFVGVRFPSTAPALKMGIAYPLSNRFRTGMTIAMFSLIVFSLSVFSAINASYVNLLTADGGDGGWDVLVTANRNSGADDIQSRLNSASAPVANDIELTGRTTLYNGSSEVRAGTDEFTAFPVLAADPSFLNAPDAKLGSWARGYDDERSVFDAVASGTTFAIVDPSVLSDGFNEFEFYVDGLTVEDDRFDAFELTYRDITTGREATVTVIGMLAIQVSSTYTAGVYVSDEAYRQTFGEPSYLRTFVKLDGGVKATQAAQDIESALITTGVQAESIRGLLDDAVREQNTFMRMFQGFMALGLLTGIAALGVIAFRSVVERRQQIGMLRAIGYQTGTVAMSFVLESGFIAVMGILSGVVGGMIISHNLFTMGQFSGSGIQFSIPWTEITVIAVTAGFVSLLMTWLPAQQAARTPVAEALRYE
jgi:putative ABC transport system permease protein